ncbi:MAG: FCD domain-containing protein [Bradyrhizobium sp.]
MLEPLETGARQIAVTRRLQQAIILGILKDGDQLPSESDLAAKLGVSTVTLRFSLAELRSFGLLETRRGRGGGNFVRLPPNWIEIQTNAQLNEISLDDLRDLRDYSAAVGGGIARFAAERIRKSAIPRLELAARAIATSSSPPEKARSDLLFHLELAAATRSARLTKSELEIQSTVAPFLWMPHADLQNPSDAAKEHMDIVNAISAGDGERARHLAEEHLSEALNRLIEFRMEIASFVSGKHR